MSQTQVGSDREPTSIPRWVKIFGIIALALVLLVGAIMLAGGEHGPGRHVPSANVTESSDPFGHVPPVEHGTQQP
jgi:hypothetical protein